MMIKENAGLALTVAAVAMGGHALCGWRSKAVDPYVAKPIGPGVITKQNTVSTDTTPSGATYNIQLLDGKSVRGKDVSPSIYYALSVPGAKVKCPKVNFTEINTVTAQSSANNPKPCTAYFPKPLTVTAATDNYSKHNNNQAVFTVEHGKTIAVILPKGTDVEQGKAYNLTLKEAIVPASNFTGYNQRVDFTAQELDRLPPKTR